MQPANRLPAEQHAVRTQDYQEAVHLPERERWLHLSFLWGILPASARDYCRAYRLWQTAADREQAGRIESRHELRQWWDQKTQRRRS